MERIKNKRIFRSMMRFEKKSFPKILHGLIGRCEMERGKNRRSVFYSMTRFKRIFLLYPFENNWGKKGVPQRFPDRTRWFSI